MARGATGLIRGRSRAVRPAVRSDAAGGASGAAVEQLEPGDAVLLSTDGVVERRSVGGFEYGIDRLIDFLHHAVAAGMSPEETLRRLSTTILDFHGGTLRDDATTLLVTWTPGGTSALGGR